KMVSRTQLVSLFVLGLVCACSGFYLPGVAPRKYVHGEQLTVKVNTLTSDLTPLQFDYYNIPFCEPKGGEKALAENLGEVLAGERTETSAYKCHTNVTRLCKVACRKVWTKENVDEFRDFAGAKYRANMRLDNLPGAELVVFRDQNGAEFVSYRLGYPIAEASDFNSTNFHINNHLRITIRSPQSLFLLLNQIDQIKEPGVLIFGFELKASSIDHRYEVPPISFFLSPRGIKMCSIRSLAFSLPQTPNPNQVVFTYDVLWVKSDVKWASRWDVYLKMQWQDDEIHWFSIVNSSVILLFLSGMVALIMLRILRKDLYRYNQVSHNPAFLGPPCVERGLAGGVGSNGSQRGRRGGGVRLGDVLPPVHPAAGEASERGSEAETFCFLCAPAGYVSAMFCKMFHGAGTDRLRTTLMTALVFPGVVFVVFFGINCVIWGDKSTGAVPFGTLVALLVFWFFISLPLVFLGSFVGFRSAPVEHPVRTNPIPRQVPDQIWYMKALPSVLMGGVLPFGVVFVELFFILSSIWQHRFYYLFGFMFLVLMILLVTCAEISVVMCYFQLCSEDYHWWWRSFFTSGMSAMYLFMYASYYFLTRVHVAKSASMISGLIFFGYMFVFSYAFMVITGFVGFISTFFFIRTIYGSIKVD
ncbi:Endomembrane protein 70-domain-containing protein, partial [Baffinella frigidus]